jgi:hypothetical protein
VRLSLAKRGRITKFCMICKNHSWPPETRANRQILQFSRRAKVNQANRRGMIREFTYPHSDARSALRK